MDYILLSALTPLLVAAVLVSYDIACQFKLKFGKQMPKLPPALHLPSSIPMEWGIPKCHCPMHKVPCQAPHSLNFQSGISRTDGEGIEWSWAEMNHVANSTKEMGPGSRHDTLDDHLCHHNFKKYVWVRSLTCLRLVGLTFRSRSDIAYSPFPCNTRTETSTIHFRGFQCVIDGEGRA